jgi:hypothetical protein
MSIDEQIIIHPYTYCYTRVIKERTEEGTRIRWFDLDSGEELPPYCGYGSGVQEKIDEWYELKKAEN